MLSSEENAILQERVLAKRTKYKEQGTADLDFMKTIGEDTLRMWLPKSVFDQQKLLSVGAKVFSSDFKDIDEEAELTKRYFVAICAHAQINGESVNAEKLGFGVLQSYALLYWMELLYPLSLWGDEKSREAILK